MISSLQAARQKYNEYFEGSVLPLLGLTDEAANELGFFDIAQRLPNSSVREKYRRLAIELLDENLREHQAERPSAIDLFEAKRVCELREWQEVSRAWEDALWALMSQQ